jgi:hypothetical protein
LSTVIGANFADYGVSAGLKNELVDAAAAVASIWPTINNPSSRTSVSIQSFNEARITAEALARQVNAFAQAFPASNENLASAGLPIRKTTRTPQQPVTVPIDLEFISAIPEQLTLQGRNPETPTSKRKPSNADAIQLAIAIGETFAVEPEQATDIRLVTKTPFVISTTPAQRGKKITVFARYQSKGSIGGIKVYGPWSAPITAVLP